jgi:hypothetical protein
MGGKQNSKHHGRKLILVYKTGIHPESQLNLAPCGIKAGPMTRHTWLIGTLRHLDHYPPTTSLPKGFTEDDEMEAAPQDYEEYGTEQATTPIHQQHPPSVGNGRHAHEGVPPAPIRVPPLTTVGRHPNKLWIGTQDPPSAPYKTRISPATLYQGNTTTLYSRFAPIGKKKANREEKKAMA